jgi:hypothetical protein
VPLSGWHEMRMVAAPAKYRKLLTFVSTWIGMTAPELRPQLAQGPSRGFFVSTFLRSNRMIMRPGLHNAGLYR